MELTLAAKKHKLRSEASVQPSYVRFVNQTSATVKIFWLNFEGNKTLFNSLKHEEFLDVNTFTFHLWIAEDELTGDRFMCEGQLVYEAKPWYEYTDGRLLPRRKLVPIRYPLYTLRARALQVTRDELSSARDVDELELPMSIKAELKYLLHKKNCLLKHRTACDCIW